jgi:hypothetical protein
MPKDVLRQSISRPSGWQLICFVFSHFRDCIQEALADMAHGDAGLPFDNFYCDFRQEQNLPASMSRTLRMLARAQADVDEISSGCRPVGTGRFPGMSPFTMRRARLLRRRSGTRRLPEADVLGRPLCQAFFKTRRGGISGDSIHLRPVCRPNWPLSFASPGQERGAYGHFK